MEPAEPEVPTGVDPLACILGPVILAAGGWIGPFATLEGPLQAGRGLRVHPQACVGGPAQHRRGAEGSLRIGEDVVIREGATVHRGSSAGGGETVIGDRVWLMAYAHVGHDAILGSDVTAANGAQLGGHVVVGPWATLGARCAIHQFVRVGAGAMIAAGALVSGDVPPWTLVAGDRARLVGPNEPGLRSRGGEGAVLRMRRVLRAVSDGPVLRRPEDGDAVLAEIGAWDNPWDPARELIDFFSRAEGRALVARRRGG